MSAPNRSLSLRACTTIRQKPAYTASLDLQLIVYMQ